MSKFYLLSYNYVAFLNNWFWLGIVCNLHKTSLCSGVIFYVEFHWLSKHYFFFFNEIRLIPWKYLNEYPILLSSANVWMKNNSRDYFFFTLFSLFRFNFLHSSHTPKVWHISCTFFPHWRFLDTYMLFRIYRFYDWHVIF